MREQSAYFFAWRKFYDISQPELAARIGVTHPTVSEIERGRRPYNEEYLINFAKALGADPIDILTRDPRKSDDFDIRPFWARLTPANRRLARGIIELMLSQQSGSP